MIKQIVDRIKGGGQPIQADRVAPARHLGQSGQALLTLLIFVVIGMAVISIAVTISVLSTQTSFRYVQSNEAWNVAEGGMENALIRMLRNPDYPGETLTVGLGTATITVAGPNPKTITSTGRVGHSSRVVEVVVDDESGVMNIISWREVY
jgi:hypothetical protein